MSPVPPPCGLWESLRFPGKGPTASTAPGPCLTSSSPATGHSALHLEWPCVAKGESRSCVDLIAFGERVLWCAKFLYRAGNIQNPSLCSLCHTHPYLPPSHPRAPTPLCSHLFFSSPLLCCLFPFFFIFILLSLSLLRRPPHPHPMGPSGEGQQWGGQVGKSEIFQLLFTVSDRSRASSAG